MLLKLKSLSLIALGAFALHSVACTVPVGITVALPISKVPGSPVPQFLNNLLPPTALDLPINEGARELPPGSKAVYITAVQFRSMLTDASDRTEDARKDESLIMECPAGRAHLGFIESITVKIKHKGEADSAAKVLATYQKPSADADPCGIEMKMADLDIKDYVDGYEIMTQGSGRTPQQDVELGGFIQLSDHIGI